MLSSLVFQDWVQGLGRFGCFGGFWEQGGGAIDFQSASSFGVADALCCKRPIQEAPYFADLRTPGFRRTPTIILDPHPKPSAVSNTESHAQHCTKP